MASNSGATAAIIASTTAINAAAAARQREALLAAFRERGALRPAQAIEGAVLDPALKTVLAWYQAEKVIRTSDDGKLYLDENALQAQQALSRGNTLKALWILLVILVAVVALVVAVVAINSP